MKLELVAGAAVAVEAVEADAGVVGVGRRGAKAVTLGERFEMDMGKGS